MVIASEKSSLVGAGWEGSVAMWIPAKKSSKPAQRRLLGHLRILCRICWGLTQTSGTLGLSLHEGADNQAAEGQEPSRMATLGVRDTESTQWVMEGLPCIEEWPCRRLLGSP